MQRIALSFFFLLLLVASADVLSGEPVRRIEMGLSLPTRHIADNTDGSCVQCSITHCGYQCNVPAAASLLYDSEFGPAIRGGSTPTRVANYCNARHIKAWNVTGTGDGQTTGTIAWMRWAAKTGRFAAIGFERAHFETLWGFDYEKQKWLVVNNQLPAKMRVDEYSHDEFVRRHMASGPWVVVLMKPSSANPQLVEWWK